MLGKVFKAYDIRATYPKPLSDKLAWQIGYGTAQYLTEYAAEQGYDDPMMRHIVVGHDMRQSSPALVGEFIQGVRDFGAHVIDVGLVDTPFIYFAINYLACCGGVQVTASHNPANYNGFKISKIAARPVGMTTGLDEIRRYAAIVDREKLTPAAGRMEQRDLWDAYRAHVLQFLDPDLISGAKKLRVVIDASNGMAGTMIPKVFDGVKGLKITKINFDNSTGEFVHEPNPLVEANLQETRDAVIAQNAHVGFCFDGDADRCMVIDETGAPIGCDLLTAWLAQELLAEYGPAPIVYDLRSSKSVPEMISEAGGTPVKSRVGHVFMKEKMAEHNGLFGGELSGHFYFRGNFYADSGAIALATVATALVRSKKKLSQHMAPARRYTQSGEINFENEEKELALKDLVRMYSKAKIERLDGVTIDMDDWWCNVRMSNTEPLLRLNLEGPDPETVADKVDEVAECLGERVAH